MKYTRLLPFLSRSRFYLVEKARKSVETIFLRVYAERENANSLSTLTDRLFHSSTIKRTSKIKLASSKVGCIWGYAYDQATINNSRQALFI